MQASEVARLIRPALKGLFVPRRLVVRYAEDGVECVFFCDTGKFELRRRRTGTDKAVFVNVSESQLSRMAEDLKRRYDRNKNSNSFVNHLVCFRVIRDGKIGEPTYQFKGVPPCLASLV